MNKIWKYESTTLPFDITEAGCMTRLLQALTGLRTNMNRFGGNGDWLPEILERHCGILQEFFDDLFGDGSGESICGRALSAEAYSRAFMAFLDFVSEQTDALQKFRKTAEEKFISRAEAMGISTPATPQDGQDA